MTTPQDARRALIERLRKRVARASSEQDWLRREDIELLLAAIDELSAKLDGIESPEPPQGAAPSGGSVKFTGGVDGRGGRSEVKWLAIRAWLLANPDKRAAIVTREGTFVMTFEPKTVATASQAGPGTPELEK